MTTTAAQSAGTTRRYGLSQDRPELDDLVFPDRIHRSLYTDPEFFEFEMERVFGGTWTYVAHESEIPRPNDFVRKRLGRRPVLVTRDRAGELHVLLNRCTHRGATVCRIEKGNARRFACPYHNWTFTNTGALAAVPIDEAYGPGFDKDALALGTARVASYRGFVFATFNPEMPSIREYLGNAADLLDAWLDRWPGAELKLSSGEHRLTYKGNWKLTFDNAHDGYHAGYSHASLLRMRHDRYGAGVDMQYALGDIDKSDLYSLDLGNGHTLLDQRPEIESYWQQKAPIPGESPYEALIREKAGDRAEAALDVAVGSGMNLNIFPNLVIIGNQVQVIEPYDVDQTTLVWHSTTLEAPDLPDEVNALRLRLQEDFPAFGEPDDLANFEECHLGLKTVPEMEWVATHRHLTTDVHTTDARGTAGPISDEHLIRAWWQRWKRAMEDPTPFKVSEETPR